MWRPHGRMQVCEGQRRSPDPQGRGTTIATNGGRPATAFRSRVRGIGEQRIIRSLVIAPTGGCRPRRDGAGRVFHQGRWHEASAHGRAGPADLQTAAAPVLGAKAASPLCFRQSVVARSVVIRRGASWTGKGEGCGHVLCSATFSFSRALQSLEPATGDQTPPIAALAFRCSCGRDLIGTGKPRHTEFVRISPGNAPCGSTADAEPVKA